MLEGGRTVLEELLHEGLSRERAHKLAAQFLFGARDLDKRVSALSGGERNRLQLAKLVTANPDFLILDEPTNHLDIPACEAIEDALADFKGTILAVSHDRYFLDKVGNRVVEVQGGKLVSSAGNFSEYWHERRLRTVAGPAARVATRRRQRERGTAPDSRGERERSVTAQIDEGERQKAELERRVADAFTHGDVAEGRRASAQLDRHNARLEKLYAEWVEEA